MTCGGAVLIMCQAIPVPCLKLPEEDSEEEKKKSKKRRRFARNVCGSFCWRNRLSVLYCKLSSEAGSPDSDSHLLVLASLVYQPEIRGCFFLFTWVNDSEEWMWQEYRGLLYRGPITPGWFNTLSVATSSTHETHPTLSFSCVFKLKTMPDAQFHFWKNTQPPCSFSPLQFFFLLLIRPSKRKKKLWIHRYLWPLVDVSPMSSKRYQRFLSAMMSQVPYITVSSRRFGSAGLSRCPYSMSRAIGQINRGRSTHCQKLTSMQPAGLH